MNQDLKPFWDIVAHKINNANANIILEISTLQLLLKKTDGSQEQILRVLGSIDLSVEIVSYCLREMEEIFEKTQQQDETLDLEVWEKDFRSRIEQLKQGTL